MANSEKLKELQKAWWDENMSHGAFAYTHEEIEYYMNLFKFKPKRNEHTD